MVKLFTKKISEKWHVAQLLTPKGQRVIGFGATVQQAISDCFKDYQIIARLND